MTATRRFLLRALDPLGRLFDRLGRTCLYLSAGLSRLADLKKGTSAAWNDFLIDDDQVGSGWMRWEHTVAERASRPGDRVLVVGCGSGRDMLPFLERGCRVTGVDPAAGAVAAAERALARRNLSAELVVGFFEDATFTGQFDLVWFSWFTYSYIPDSRRRIDALRKAATILSPGGRAVISVMRSPPESRLLVIAAFLGRRFGADWAITRGDVFSRIVGSPFLRYEHYFAAGEAEAEAAAAGLDTAVTIERDTILVLSPSVSPTIHASVCN